MMSRASEVKIPITNLLQRWRQGDDGAMDQLAPMVYRELQKRAGVYLKKERRNHTLSATDLVHEVYLRMVNERDRHFNNRLHFFALASKVMRDILIQYSRASNTEKRGGNYLFIAPENLDQLGDPKVVDLVPHLAEAVDALAQKDARKAWIVEMHYFAGLKVDEIAEVLELSNATVHRDLQFSRAWLRKLLEENRA